MNHSHTIAFRLLEHYGHNLEVRAVGGTADIDCLDCVCGVLHCPEDEVDTYKKWLPYDGNECEIAIYGPEEDPEDITVECGYTVLVSAETDGEFQCPRCGQRFPGTDFSELTVISDHGHCYDCHKAWQHGEDTE